MHSNVCVKNYSVSCSSTCYFYALTNGWCLFIFCCGTEYMEEHGVDSVNLQRVVEGRRNRDTFHWFLDNIASSVVSKRVVDQVKGIKRP